MTSACEERPHYDVVAEAQVDPSGRVDLSNAGATPGQLYRIERDVDGVFKLTPVVSIPEREMIVWENRELAGRLEKSLAEAERGDLIDRGDPATVLEIGPHP